MACDISSGRLRACKEFVGGLSSIYLLNFVEDAFTVVGGEATAINPLITDVYNYQIDGYTHNLTQNYVSSVDSGTSVNTQTLTFMLKGMDAATSVQINTIVKGKTIAVVKDNNGKYIAIGTFKGLDFNVDSLTGAVMTDMNGYTLTGVGMAKENAPFLDSATVTAFLALVA